MINKDSGLTLRVYSLNTTNPLHLMGVEKFIEGFDDPKLVHILTYDGCLVLYTNERFAESIVELFRDKFELKDITEVWRNETEHG